jgi:UDP-GlcNAc:undecaprenyl-phosphate GlcNAc-1-phosphate transferase
MAVILSFALALFVTTVLLPLCRRYAPAIGLVDTPGAERKVHAESIPRSGGIAIVVGALVAAVMWLPDDATYLPLAGCLGVVIVFGLLDDLHDLRHGVKFIGQAIAAAWFLFAFGGVSQLPFFALDAAPQWLCLLLSFLFLVGVTNGVNLSDGLDGLAAGNSLLSLGLLALLAAQIDEPGYVVIALSVAGGLLGFLRFNTHPASVFMGDTGSQFIGFAAAALTLLIMQDPAMPVSPMLPVLIFGLPILDTLSVMGVRLVRGRPMFQADKSHLHHQFLNMGFKHFEAVAILYALQALVVGLAYLVRFQSDGLVLSAYGAYCFLVLGFLMWARLANWQVRARSNGGGHVERRNLWLRQFDWYHQHTAKVLSAGIAVFFLASAWYLRGASDQLANIALVSAAVLAVAWLYFREQPAFVSRLICFTASAFVVYGFLFHTGVRPVFNLAADVYIAGLAVALFLAIRMTRRSLFHLDNQDYLVLLIVALVPFLPLAEFDGTLVARVVLRLAVLLYACEFVITKGGKTKWIINGAGIGSLVMMGS